MSNRNTREGMSLAPNDAVAPNPTLMDLLLIGEEDCDFRTNARGDNAEQTRRIIGVVVDWERTVVNDVSITHKITKASVQRLATKSGVFRIEELPGWDALNRSFDELKNRAIDSKDRSAVQFLESKTSFRFANPKTNKTAINAYPWVFFKVDKFAETLGISASHMLVACLILGLSDLPEWKECFEDDIKELVKHIARRGAALNTEV